MIPTNDSNKAAERSSKGAPQAKPQPVQRETRSSKRSSEAKIKSEGRVTSGSLGQAADATTTIEVTASPELPVEVPSSVAPSEPTAGKKRSGEKKSEETIATAVKVSADDPVEQEKVSSVPCENAQMPLASAPDIFVEKPVAPIYHPFKPSGASNPATVIRSRRFSVVRPEEPPKKTSDPMDEGKTAVMAATSAIIEATGPVATVSKPPNLMSGLHSLRSLVKVKPTAPEPATNAGSKVRE